MISINNSFGQSEEAIFKNSKASKKTDYPSTLSSQLYFTADALTEPLNIANTVSHKPGILGRPVRSVDSCLKLNLNFKLELIFTGTELCMQYVCVWGGEFEINIQRGARNLIRRYKKIDGLSCRNH